MEETVDEQDVQLQLQSRNLIFQVEKALPQLLRHTSGEVRSRASSTKTSQVIGQLDQFQESPQLLDRHLSGIVLLLASSFSEYIGQYKDLYQIHCRSSSSRGAFPLPRAVSKIMYTLCKVRGQKVIAQLLNNEPKCLEPMVEAFHTWTDDHTGEEDHQTIETLISWEERYTMLLWLSHLMLVPFDLVSIASDDPPWGTVTEPYLPRDTPKIAAYLFFIATKYLKVSSKEREAAKTLLVRLASRTDMQGFKQGLDVDTKSLKWEDQMPIMAILGRLTVASGNMKPKHIDLNADTQISSTAFTLVENIDISAQSSLHAAIGSLSFIAAFAKSCGAHAFKPHFPRLWSRISIILTKQSPQSMFLTSSSIVRKLIVKLYRVLAVAAHSLQLEGFEDIMTHIIEYLCAALDDHESVVRLAASKSLGVIASQIDDEMKGSLIEMVLENLGDDTGSAAMTASLAASQVTNEPGMTAKSQPDFRSVNILRWHGHIMTLSHMLYQHSIRTGHLFRVMLALITALNLNQQTALGAATGTNVRDAACFGIWALARKYKTQEINNATSDTDVSEELNLQILATELVKASSFDPAGNIRRGASAALQEMVGRHPDQIVGGIALVQIVDYHAVALKSSAMITVCLKASKVSPKYWVAAFEGLLGWRGAQHNEEATRKLAAQSLGFLGMTRHGNMSKLVDILQDRVRHTPEPSYELIHGFFLAMAEIIAAVHGAVHIRCGSTLPVVIKVIIELEIRSLDLYTCLQRDDMWLRAGQDQQVKAAIERCTSEQGLSHREYKLQQAVCHFFKALASATSCEKCYDKPSQSDVEHYLELAWNTLYSIDAEVHETAGLAMCSLLVIAPLSTQIAYFERFLQFLAPVVDRHKLGHINALGLIFDLRLSRRRRAKAVLLRAKAIEIMIELTWSEGIDIKRAALKSMAIGPVKLGVYSDSIMKALKRCLFDYTNDKQRGDVGSLVRIVAIDTAALALQEYLKLSPLSGGDFPWLISSSNTLLFRICALATENLDKVRFRAAKVLQQNWTAFNLSSFPRPNIINIIDTTTSNYFRTMLHIALLSPTDGSLEILKGFVTSAASTAPESLVQASRAALGQVVQIDDFLNKIASELLSLTSPTTDTPPPDRILTPTLEVLSHLFDINALQRLETSTLPQNNWSAGRKTWHTLLSHTSKAHHRSSDLRKLTAAVGVYRGLSTLSAPPDIKVRNLAVGRLWGMLGSPFAKVRATVADALYLHLTSTNAEMEGLADRVLDLDLAGSRDTEQKGVIAEMRATWEGIVREEEEEE